MMQNMMKTMGGMAGGGKAKFDMNKMNSMMAKTSSRQKMLDKLEKRRAAAASSSAHVSTIPTDYILEQCEKPNEYVFKMTDETEGMQEKSFAPPAKSNPTDNWLENEPVTKSKSTASKSKSKKGGKKGK